MTGAAWLLLATCVIGAMTPTHGYHYIGCYVDRGTRDLPVKAGSGSMSAAMCNNLCSTRRYKYFGVQYSKECWCGNTYGRYGARSSRECNMRCSGQHSAFCGAGWRNSIYASDYAPGLRFIGCFADAGTRDLPVLAGTGSMNVRKCFGLCQNRHFAYLGLQNANECWCGNGFGRFGGRSTGECKMRCSGDRHALCGAGWRNSVYATGLSPLSVPSASSASHAMLRSQMAAQIKAQYVSFPSGVMCHGCLITQWRKQEVDVKSKVFPVKDMNSVMASFPAKVRDKVRVLQFGVNAKTQFEDFHINVSGNQAVRKSYLGMAKRVNGNVELGMVAVELVGNLVPKYNVYHRKVCRKILWVFKKCKTHVIHQRRGYHGSEINQIDIALRSETFRLFGEKLGLVNL